MSKSDYTQNLLIVIGPTATGKTKLALELAKDYNGELISADSRQVYKYMNIGTGKDVPQTAIFQLQSKNGNLSIGYYEIEGVLLWGLDIVDPDYQFNVSDWVNYTKAIIEDAHRRGKLPIITGGTGQYINSLINSPESLNIPINPQLRRQLDGLFVQELQQKLMKINKIKWESMNVSDRQNPRRLVRAIEIAEYNHKNQTPKVNADLKTQNVIILGLASSRKSINERIDIRVEHRMRFGMAEEVKQLVEKGYTWKLPSMKSLGYREFEFIATSLEERIKAWKISEHQYAKRQMLYLKKFFPQAKWFDISFPEWRGNVDKYLKENLSP